LVPERGFDLLLLLALGSVALVAGARFAAADSEHRGARIARVTALVIMAWTATSTWQVSPERRAIFSDRTNNAVLMAAARDGGMLATSADLHLVQLRTRRPVLLDGGGLDGLPYALASGTEMERILRDVYAIDFFNPPDEARGSGVIPREANRATWEGYSQEKWRHIGRIYGVTHVLAYPDWQLALPVVARDGAHVLYRIPGTDH
jgi:hypothetical protein